MRRSVTMAPVVATFLGKAVFVGLFNLPVFWGILGLLCRAPLGHFCCFSHGLAAFLAACEAIDMGP